MAPLKTRPSTSKTSAMKQSTLGFSAIKRSASLNSDIGSLKKKKAALTSTKSSLQQASSLETPPPQSPEEISSSSSSSSDGTSVTEELEISPKAVVHRRLGAAKAKEMVDVMPNVELNDFSLDDKERRWTKLYGDVRRRAGYMPQIHSPEENKKVHHILRVFDLSYEYGPCVGLTRLQRWERAKAMGRNPPSEIREILLSKEAVGKEDILEGAFHDAGI